MTGLQPDTNAIADQLLKDIKELSDGVRAKDFDINTTKIAGGAQTLLDEVARTKISGEEETFSHTDLWDFKPTSTAHRTPSRPCGRFSMNASPNWDKRSTSASRKSTPSWASTARVMDSSSTTR